MAWKNEVGYLKKSSENGVKFSEFFIVYISGNKPQRTKRGKMSDVEGGNIFLSKKIVFFLTVRFAQKLMLKTRKNSIISYKPQFFLNYLYVCM
jgi:hypothetical protein